MESISVVAEKIQESGTRAGEEFATICGSHEDYIWQSVTGSGGGNVGQERGTAGFSTYFICDEDLETEADDLMTSTFGHLYDAQVKAGNLTSWGWMQHWVGGKYRRINTMTSGDFDTLIAARDAIVQGFIDNEEAGTRFSEICSSHSDYIWEVRLETP
jgi:hypothetical protein